MMVVVVAAMLVAMTMTEVVLVVVVVVRSGQPLNWTTYHVLNFDLYKSINC